jgi:hypothetical protein
MWYTCVYQTKKKKERNLFTDPDTAGRSGGVVSVDVLTLCACTTVPLKKKRRTFEFRSYDTENFIQHFEKAIRAASCSKLQLRNFPSCCKRLFEHTTVSATCMVDGVRTLPHYNWCACGPSPTQLRGAGHPFLSVLTNCVQWMQKYKRQS